MDVLILRPRFAQNWLSPPPPIDLTFTKPTFDLNHFALHVPSGGACAACPVLPRSITKTVKMYSTLLPLLRIRSVKKRECTNWYIVLCALLLGSLTTNAQTTITTDGSASYNGGNGVSGNGVITFVVENSSGADILLTDLGAYWQTGNSGSIPKLWASSTSLSGPYFPFNTSEWTLLSTGSPVTVPANGYYPTITGISYLIPNGASRRFLLESDNGIRYSGSGVITPNTFSNGGVHLRLGDFQIAGSNVGYGGLFTNSGNNPRYFTGSITFAPAAACAGIPIPGTISGSSLVCSGSTTVLDLTGSSAGTGITRTWYSSTNPGGPYTTLAGTGNSITTAPITANTYYVVEVTCTEAGGGTSTTAEHAVMVNNGFGGTFTIDPTLPAAGTNFQTFTEAINFLNSQGDCIGSPVVFNVADDQVFNENTPAITASGNSVNTIIFQKDGTGANPRIVKTGTTATNEFGLAIHGGDYITIDGVDIAAATGTALDYGYVIRNASATNGADHNTIKNGKVVVGMGYTSSRGIVISSSTTGGGVTATSAEGACRFNLIENMVVETANLGGIFITSASTTIPGEGNDVLGCTVGAPYVGTPTGDIDLGDGIEVDFQQNFRIHGNTVRNVAGAGDNNGINIVDARGVVEVSNNIVYGVRNTSTSSTTQVSGIQVDGDAAGAEIRVFNNFVSDITSAYTGTGTTRHVAAMATVLGDADVTYRFDHNNVSMDLSGTSASGVGLDFASATSINIATNNNFVNTTNPATNTKKQYGIETGSTTLIGATGSHSDYNNFYLPGANGYIGLVSTIDAATTAAWDSFLTEDADQNSLTVDPGYVNPQFDLHVTNMAISGEGSPVPLAWTAQDIDGEFRPVPPTIGAHELVPAVECTGTPVAGSISASDPFLCTVNSGTTLTFSGSSDLSTTYQWASSTTAGGPYTDLGTTLQQITGALTTTTYYVVTTTCTNSGLSNTSPEYSVEVRPTPTLSASNNSPLCIGSTLQLNATSDIGTTYSWTGPAAFTSTDQNPTLAITSVNQSGEYFVTTSSNGCTSEQASTTVSVNPAIVPQITAGPNPACIDGTTQLGVSINSQANQMTFTTGTDAVLDPMAGATVIVNSAVDDVPGSLHPIGFSFGFNGQQYTEFSASPDGFMKLGAPAASSDFSNSTTDALNTPRIFPYWDDLATGSDGNVSYVVTGTAPNRILKVQWFVRNPRLPLTDPANSTFQAWLYENGTIEFVYGFVNPNANTASVGIAAAANNFQSVTVDSNTASTTTAVDNNSSQPSIGRYYRFAPPAYTYLWSPSANLDDATSATPIATGLTGTTEFTVDISDGLCTESASITVEVGADVSVSMVEDCAGQSFSVNVDIATLGSTAEVEITYSVNGVAQPAVLTSTSTVLGPFEIYDLVEVSSNNGYATCAEDFGSFYSTCPIIVDCASGQSITIPYCYKNNDPRQFVFIASDPTSTLDLKFLQPSPIASGDGINLFSGTPGNNQIPAIVSNDDLSTLGIVTSAADTLSFTINSNASGSCEDGALTSNWTFQVRCSGCLEPQGDMFITTDCNALNFNALLDLYDLGTDSTGTYGPTVTIAYTVNGGDTIFISDVVENQHILGDFPLGTVLNVAILHASEAACNNVLGEFTIPVSACPNDEPCQARALTMNPNYSCVEVVEGSLAGMTASAVTSSCTGTADDDVWFSFVATAPTHRIQLLNIDPTTTLYHALFTGSCAGGFTHVGGACYTSNTSNPAGLTVGTTYYVQVYSSGSTPVSTTFDVCVSAPPDVDMRVTGLVSPPAAGCYGSAVPVTVTVNNNSWLPIDFSVNPTTVNVTATGGYISSAELNTGTLAAGASMAVTMPEPIDMSVAGAYTFNATTIATGEGAPSNDAMTPATRTSTAPTALPTAANFTGFTGANLATIHPGWREGTGATVPTGTTSSWLQSGTTAQAVLGSGVSAKVNLFAASKNEWIVTPKFVATSGTVLNYSVAITDFGNGNADASGGMQGTDDRVVVRISTNCGATYSDLVTYDASNTSNISNALVPQTIDLSAYAGNEVIIGFYATEGTVNDLPDYDFHLDNIVIQNIPLCSGTPTAGTAALSDAGPVCAPASTNLSLTGQTSGVTGITIQWQSATTAGGPYTDIADATQTSHQVTGLMVSTWFRALVTCTNSGLSSTSNEVTVVVTPTPSASASNDGPVCAGEDLQLTGSTDFGTSFSWNGPDGFASTDQNPTIADIGVSGNGIYTLIATANGCPSAPATTSVSVESAPLIESISADPIAICNGDSTQLEVIATASLPNMLITEVTLFSSTGDGATPTYPPQLSGTDLDLVELNNASSVPADISGWQLTVHPTNSTTVSHELVFPSGTIVPPNGVVVVHLETTGTTDPENLFFVTGESTSYSSGSALGVVLRNGSIIVDAVGVNTYTFAAGTGVTEADWSGSAPSPSGDAGTTRTGALDTNTGADWTASEFAPQSIGTYNAGYTNPNSGTIASYSWTPGASLSDPTISNPMANGLTETTTFVVVVATTAGCTSTDSVTVTVGEPLVVDVIASTDTICASEEVTLSAIGTGGGEPYTYSWSPGGETTAEITVNPTVTTEYTVTVTDNCGSIVPMSSTVTVLPTPTVSAAHTAPVCTGSTLQLTGTADMGTYAWTGPDGFTSPDLSPSIADVTFAASGTYTLTATFGECSTSATTEVEVGYSAGVVTVSPEDPSICASGSVELVASGAGIETFGSGVITGTSPTTSTASSNPYYRTFENRRTQYVILASEITAAGFDQTLTSLSFQVTAAASPNNLDEFTMKLGHTTNTNASTLFTGPLTTVYGPVDYIPVVGTNTHVFNEPFVWDGVSNLVIEICFTNDPDNTCTNVSSSCWGNSPTVQMATAPMVATWVTYADNVAQCDILTSDATSTLRPIMTFGYGADLPATYSWSPSAGLNTATGDTVIASPTETTTYTVTGTLPNGCSSSADVTVTIGAPLVASIELSADTICAGETTVLTAVGAGGGLPYGYLWSPGGETTAEITVEPSATTEYTVTITDDCGGQAIASATVTVLTAPTVTATHTSPVCEGGDLQLTATADMGTYSWSGPAGFASTDLNPVIPNVTQANAGTYIFTSGLGSCSVSAETIVSIGVAPVITSVTATPETICSGDTVQLQVVMPSGAALCTSNATNTTDEWLSNVTFAGIVNSSASTTYSDYTGIVGNVIAGSTYTFSGTVTNGTTFEYSETVRVYIDWDQDGAFGAGEVYDMGNQPVPGGADVVFSDDIIVPANALDGTTTMRVINRFNEYHAATGCGSFTYGEVEDYSLNVSGGTPTGLIYSWSPITFLDDATIADPMAEGVTSTTEYTITVTNAAGCASSASVTVTVNTTDTDSDGVVDCEDSCPNFPGEIGDPCDAGPGMMNGVITVDCECVGEEIFVTVNSSLFLDGPFNTTTGLMSDNLRSLGLIPSAHPYGGAPWNHTGTETFDPAILAVTGNDAIVDWVLLELRDAATPATVVARRAALVQRDGDLVDTDGVSVVKFAGVPSGNYRLAVRHRNHLGVMTGTDYALSQIPTDIDLTLPGTTTYGTNARRTRGAVMTMWGGNANGNTNVRWFGLGNDDGVILSSVGASTPTATLSSVYHNADVNMNGQVRWFGLASDSGYLLNTIGSTTPTGTILQQLP